MYSLIYICSAVAPFSPAELDELLKKSRSNNHDLDITGLLLYKDGSFMQLLEGPEAAVKTTLLKIEADPRHRGILVLLERERAEREFSEWSMGFKCLDGDTVKSVPGYSEFMNLPLNSPEFEKTPSQALHLLQTFKRIAA